MVLRLNPASLAQVSYLHLPLPCCYPVACVSPHLPQTPMAVMVVTPTAAREPLALTLKLLAPGTPARVRLGTLGMM